MSLRLYDLGYDDACEGRGFGHSLGYPKNMVGATTKRYSNGYADAKNVTVRELLIARRAGERGPLASTKEGPDERSSGRLP